MRTDTKLPLLTAEQEVSLAHLVHGSDAAAGLAARNELVTRNLGLVGAAAARYRRSWPEADYDDLFSEGLVGLIRAAELYDPDRHTRFSTYACKAISHAMREHLQADRPVHVPAYLQEPSQLRVTAARIRRPAFRRRLEGNLRQAGEALARAVSLSQSAADGAMAPQPADERPSPLDAMIEQETIARLIPALARLKPLRAYILIRRLGLRGGREHTLRSLGRELGVTAERIRQLEVQALAELAAILAPDQKSCA